MGGSSGGTSKQISEPWASQKPYLEDIYASAGHLRNVTSAAPWTGASTVGPSAQTQQALNAAYSYGMTPSQLMSNSQGAAGVIAGGGLVNNFRAYHPELTKTASGAYLDAGNPYLQGAIGSATRPLVDNFQQSIMPAIAGQFALGGRYGSPGAHGAAVDKAAGGLMRQIGDIGASMSYQNYGDERSRQEAAAGQLAGLYGQERGMQMQAIGMAPGMQQADMQRLGLLGSVGQQYDTYSQNALNDAMRIYYEQRDAPWEQLSRYNAMITGAGTPGYTTTSTGGAGSNPAMGALGGALSGAGVGATVGGPWGALIGAGVGAAGGYAASR